MTDRQAIGQLRRLMIWLEAFKECFGHRAQTLALRRYIHESLTMWNRDDASVSWKDRAQNFRSCGTLMVTLLEAPRLAVLVQVTMTL